MRDFAGLIRLDRTLRDGVAWLAERPWRSVLALALLCLVFYLPGFATIPVTDRDEARYAQATKQMLESGDFIDIRFQDKPRYKKPAGIYWLQAASVALLGDGPTRIWAYRVPSLVGAILAVILTWWALRPIFGRESALVGAALLAGCVTLVLEAHIAKSDAALIACIALAQGALARLYLLRRPREKMVGIAAAFWVALGLGVMIKGPVAPTVAALTIGALLLFDRRRDWLRQLHIAWGVPVFLLIVLPWFIAIGVISEGEFFRLSFGQDFLAKVKSGQEKHWGPPGFYFLSFWWTFWPAALFAAGGAALWLWRNRLLRRSLFLLAWIVPFWLIIELVPTKLPHYALPLYPAIAIGAAWVLREQVLSGRIPVRTYKQAAVLWLLIALAQAIVFGAAMWFFGVQPTAALIGLAAVFAVVAPLTAVASWRGQFFAAAGLALVSAAVLYWGVLGHVLPRLKPLWISEQLAEVVNAVGPCAGRKVALVGYREPSAVFLLGTDTVLSQGREAAAWLRREAGRIAVVSQRQKHAFDAAFADGNQTAPAPFACVSGFNVNGGRMLRLGLYSLASPESLKKCPIPPRYRCGAE